MDEIKWKLIIEGDYLLNEEQTAHLLSCIAEMIDVYGQRYGEYDIESIKEAVVNE